LNGNPAAVVGRIDPRWRTVALILLLAALAVAVVVLGSRFSVDTLAVIAIAVVSGLFAAGST
jgi:hypothetical protein